MSARPLSHEQFEFASCVRGQGTACQAHAATFIREHVVVAVVADGTGGVSGGGVAAERVVELVRRAMARGNLLNEPFWKQALLEAGVELEDASMGETTAVVAATDGSRVVGASVGDSVGWLISSRGLLELTEGQPRKPLLGGGLAQPRAFSFRLGVGDSLLLATDGLVKYASLARICGTVLSSGAETEGLCEHLVNLARLPTGRLHGDIGVVILRRGPSLESQLADAAREFRSTSLDSDDDAARCARDAFMLLLERWIGALCPPGPWSGRWADGSVLHDRAFERGDVIRATGWSIAVADQTWHPFDVRLKLGPAGLVSFDVRFGDAAGSARPPNFLPIGAPREWLFTFQGP